MAGSKREDGDGCLAASQTCPLHQKKTKSLSSLGSSSVDSRLPTRHLPLNKYCVASSRNFPRRHGRQPRDSPRRRRRRALGRSAAGPPSRRPRLDPTPREIRRISRWRCRLQERPVSHRRQAPAPIPVSTQRVRAMPGKAAIPEAPAMARHSGHDQPLLAVSLCPGLFLRLHRPGQWQRGPCS